MLLGMYLCVFDVRLSFDEIRIQSSTELTLPSKYSKQVSLYRCMFVMPVYNDSQTYCLACIIFATRKCNVFESVDYNH